MFPSLRIRAQARCERRLILYGRIEGSPTRNQLAMTLRGLLLKLSATEGVLNGLPEGEHSRQIRYSEKRFLKRLTPFPEETTFDIGIKMQDDFDVDPTVNDRLKVSSTCTHWHACRGALPLTRTSFGASTITHIA